MREQGADAVVVRGDRGERERTSEASDVDGWQQETIEPKDSTIQLGDEGT